MFQTVSMHVTIVLLLFRICSKAAVSALANATGMSCSCKLYCSKLLLVAVFIEQIID